MKNLMGMSKRLFDFFNSLNTSQCDLSRNRILRRDEEMGFLSGCTGFSSFLIKISAW